MSHNITYTTYYVKEIGSLGYEPTKLGFYLINNLCPLLLYIIIFYFFIHTSLMD